jgi:surfactin synthase thioesterase subunit
VAVRDRLTPAAASVLTGARQPYGGGPCLIAMGHAGAGASVFVPWANALGDRLWVRGVRPPGRESRLREPPHEAIGAVSREIAQALLEDEEPHPPTVLFGHCLGAWVMLEVARHLRRAGYSLRALVVSSQAPPELRTAAAPLPGRQSSEAFWDEVLALGGVPPEVSEDPELKEVLEPALRADFAMARRPPAAVSPLDIPVHGVRGDRDSVISTEEVAAWANWSKAGFRLHVITGDHFLLAGESLQTLGRLLLRIATDDEAVASANDAGPKVVGRRETEA